MMQEKLAPLKLMPDVSDVDYRPASIWLPTGWWEPKPMGMRKKGAGIAQW